MSSIQRLIVTAAVMVFAASVTACGGSSRSESDCETEARVVFWGGTQWVELAKALGAHRADCTEYYVTIPPQDADKTLLRGRRALQEVRKIDPHIHAVAEIRFTSEAGWRAWAEAEGRSFYDAGVEARRRMTKAGLDVKAGEIWALNELDAEVRENVAGRREEVREFLRGLYEGGDELPDARGIVFDIGALDVPDLTAYKATLQEWLTDAAFWGELDKYVDVFAEEVYAGPQSWAVSGASLDARTESLIDFLYHVPALAQAGPDSAETARRFLERTYVPLANAAWPHALIAQTNLVSAETMAQFVSGEVYAMRQYGEDAKNVPADAMGFAWAPNPAEPRYSEAGRDIILNRLATAIHDALGSGGTPMRACEAQDGSDWCDGDIDGASFEDAWKMFVSWE